MVKREVKFYVRVFPTVQRDVENFKIENNRQTMHVRAPQDIHKYAPKHIYWEFQTDGIFCNSCQRDVYNVSVRDIVRRALNGEDFIVLAYGPSCTGKTYTMTGLRVMYEQRGIAPRLIYDVYHLIAEFAEVSNVKIYISFVEFLGKEVRDLLTKGPNAVTKIQLVDTAGVESITSTSRSDPCQISSNMAMCWINYVIANASRVHPDDEKPALLRTSQLGEYIGPALIKGNIRLICHVRLTKDDLLPTLNAMKFGADIKKKPPPELVYAKKPSGQLLLQSLQDENHKLKDELLLNELLKGEFRQPALSQEELSHISRVVEEYLQGRINSPSILSSTDKTILLPIVRYIYKRDLAEKKKEAERAEERSPMKRVSMSATMPSITSKRSKRALVALSKVRNIKSLLGSRSRVSTSMKSLAGIQAFTRGSQAFMTGSQAVVKDSQIIDPRKSLGLSTASIFSTSADDVTRDNLWQEFFKRYPELEKRLRTLRFNLNSTLSDKEEASKNVKELRCRLDDAKFKLDDAQWRRKATLGDALGPDGQEIRSEAEKEAELEVENISKEFLQAKQKAVHTHAKYMDIMTIYNELNETARMEFQEYINKVYTTTLILPELDTESIEQRLQKSESVRSIPKRRGSIEDEEEQDRQRTYFEHLQMCHGKSLVTPQSLDLTTSCRHIKCTMFYQESGFCRIARSQNRSL